MMREYEEESGASPSNAHSTNVMRFPNSPRIPERLKVHRRKTM